MSIRVRRHPVRSSTASRSLLCTAVALLLAFAGAIAHAQSVAPTLTIQWPSSSIGRGSITMTVDGYSSTIRYGEFSTAASIAANFGGLISQDIHAPVWVKGYKDGTVRMKARSGTISGTPTICIVPDGSSGCQQPGGTSVATGGVDPAGVYLGDAVYGYVIQKSDGSTGYDQAGNIVGYSDTVNGQWTAGYDTMNRLTSAYQALTSAQLTAGQSIATPWGSAAQQYLCWQYDAWGNRRMQTSSNSPMADSANCTAAGGASAGYTNVSYDDSNGTNHITNYLYEYDGAGNVTGDGNYTYQYDSDGRLCAVRQNVTGTMTGYLYDAEGQRVSKGSINPPNPGDTASWCNLSTNNFTPATHDILGTNGTKLITLDGNDNWQSTNIYANGELVATYDTAGTHYQFSDWLGTRRKQTDIYGNAQEVCMGGAYGEVNCPMSGTNPLHFAGKERDGESGLDDFGARYYNSGIGRFISPDWAIKAEPVPYAKLDDPQSLNLYSYVRNSPLGSADLDGHDDYMDGWQDGTERKILLAGMKDEKEKVQGAAAQTWHAIDRFMSSGSDLINDHPIIAAGLFLGMNPQADESAGSLLSKEVEAEAPVIEQETVSVYQKVNSAYVGITNDLERRASQHGEPLTPIVQGLTRLQSKGVEQAVILQRGLGNLTNKINSISTKNPVYDQAVEFGKRVLQSIGFK